MRLVNQIAAADVKSVDGMLGAPPATVDVADGTSSELPACRLRRVTQHIQENLQRELRLAELSGLVHMSPYHFARLFKRTTGVPPHRFLVRRRIDVARALLEARTVPIAEIAGLVGFRTPSHFTTTFRRVTGLTPSEYRRGAGASGVRSTSVLGPGACLPALSGDGRP
jgi:AraC-like DNA-binding protein